MNILLVDDDESSRSSIAKFLRRLGYQVTESNNGQDALEKFIKLDYQMVLSDIKMPVMTGVELLERIAKLPDKTHVDVILFTGNGDMESAISALKSGATDYLLKPINIEELALITERIERQHQLLKENETLTHKLRELTMTNEEIRKELNRVKSILVQSHNLDKIGIFSQKMRELVNMAKRYHQDPSIPVLIEGETGTGKEVLARLIHYGDNKDTTPLIDINCAALTGSLFESELFGYEAGAFTGGKSAGQKGKLDLASGGTLFLDEVAEIPMELQGKLLRLLQQREYYRVGGLKKLHTDARFVFATNVDLAEQVEAGKFRRDLYFRLKIGHLIIPPLRERREEILPLALMFLQQYAKERKKKFSSISHDATQLLQSYPWSGNVRELRNVIEWATFMYNDEELKLSHLSQLNKNPAICSGNSIKTEIPLLDIDDLNLPDDSFELEQFIDAVILKALDKHSGNKTEAAKYLGMSRRALSYRLDRIQR